MASTRFVLPYQTVITAAGVPIPGALLNFYQSGTSTPLTTYSDSALTIPNTNPVVANAGGQFPSIFLQAAAYAAVLTDSLGNQIWTADPVQGAPTTLSTRQVFLSGAANYITPAGCRQLRIRMIGGGGGGAGTGTSGNTTGPGGQATAFSTSTAAGGTGGSNNVQGGQGGTGGSGGVGPASFRLAGEPGGNAVTAIIGAALAQPGGGQGGGQGGGTPVSGSNGAAAVAGTGAGGAGAGAAGQTFTDLANWQTAGGGGQGEYLELIINQPAATYAYSVGAGGAGGNPGTSGFTGGAGGGGYIIVDEYY